MPSRKPTCQPSFSQAPTRENPVYIVRTQYPTVPRPSFAPVSVAPTFNDFAEVYISAGANQTRDATRRVEYVIATNETVILTGSG
eukprot:gene44953-55952_t